MTLLFSAKNVLKADSDDATSDDVIVAVMSFFHPPASSSSLLSFFSLLLLRCFRSAASVGNFTSSAERTRNMIRVVRLGNGCGSVGRAVDSGTRDLRFEPRQRQNFIYQLYDRKDENKGKEAWNGTSLKKLFSFSR